MRLWSLHPSYLDAKGLVALWRETLLAQKVLLGKTKGYRNHPQLLRFKQTGNAVGAVANYLRDILKEAENRHYQFDQTRIAKRYFRRSLPVTRGQLEYEYQHLLAKLNIRDQQQFIRLKDIQTIEPHPLFHIVEGPVEEWEVIPNEGDRGT